jgi:hypothetical protein
MQRLKHFLSIIIVLGSLFTVVSCGNDDASPSESERITTLLTSGVWKIQSLTVDGATHDELFPNLTLTFTKGTLTTANGNGVWPASATWTFNDQAATSFKRADGVDVSITEISETQMVLSLTWNKTTLKAGKENSLSGLNVFTFGK